MVWPWTNTFWPKNVIRSSVSRDAPVTKVWRKSVSRYWRYRGNIKLPSESRTDGRTDGRTDSGTYGRTTRKHTASAGAYRRRRLKIDNINCNDSSNVSCRWAIKTPSADNVAQRLVALSLRFVNAIRLHFLASRQQRLSCKLGWATLALKACSFLNEFGPNGSNQETLPSGQRNRFLQTA